MALNSFSAMFSQLPCLGVWQNYLVKPAQAVANKAVELTRIELG